MYFVNTNLLKSVMGLQYIFKSEISTYIIRLVTDGTKALCNISSKLLMNYLTKFNRDRNQALIC
jgi:hypothetical protein